MQAATALQSARQCPVHHFCPYTRKMLTRNIPTRSPAYHATTYDTASSFLQHAGDALNLNPVDSNIILAHALKTLDNEKAGYLPLPGQLWIVCSSGDNVDLILSCTTGPMGKYPIFIYSPHSQIDNQYMRPRMECLVGALSLAVTPRRVYSVFARDPITRMFVTLWSQKIQVPRYDRPYYHARLLSCTQQSFINQPALVLPGLTCEFRLATEEDIPEAAILCRGFSEASVCIMLCIFI